MTWPVPRLTYHRGDQAVSVVLLTGGVPMTRCIVVGGCREVWPSKPTKESSSLCMSHELELVAHRARRPTTAVWAAEPGNRIRKDSIYQVPWSATPDLRGATLRGNLKGVPRQFGGVLPCLTLSIGKGLRDGRCAGMVYACRGCLLALTMRLSQAVH